MALLELIDASKKLGEKLILDEASFSANKGDKIAIIGKNGAGKSSLLNILAGTLQLDSGRRILQNGTSLAMLSQNVNFSLSLSVEELLKQELHDIFSALEEYELLQEKLAANFEDKALLKRNEELSDFLDAKDAWSLERKITQAFESLNLTHLKHKIISTLSGGEIRRISLCVLLLKAPDILLLDEPTNHLDVYMSEFLAQMLKASKNCVIFISHDRYFIDEVALKCVEIEEGKMSAFEGGYTRYLEKKAEILASLSKSYETLVKQLKSEEEWLRRGVKARLKRNEGRKERILKMREEAKKNPAAIKRLKLEISRASKHFNQKEGMNRQKMLFELKNLSKFMGEKCLFKDFSARILQKERIGIVGKNGCGKSTFLKILLGEQKPDLGQIKRGEVKIGYFDQARALLNTDKTLLEIFCPNGGDRVQVRDKNMHVYGYLKQFLFPKEYLDKPVSVLSGGEKNRVALALLFTQAYDVLVLDEPTNDLDIATINILEEYLLSFTGAILLVSHDRYFVDKIATKLFIFEDEGRIEAQHISFSEYLENEKEFKEVLESSKTEPLKEEKQKNKSAKLSYKENEILNTYPDQIALLEAQIKELEAALSDEKIYKDKGIESLFSELKAAQDKLLKLEEAYFKVLEKQG